jgi:hypothetical protein
MAKPALGENIHSTLALRGVGVKSGPKIALSPLRGLFAV